MANMIFQKGDRDGTMRFSDRGGTSLRPIKNTEAVWVEKADNMRNPLTGKPDRIWVHPDLVERLVSKGWKVISEAQRDFEARVQSKGFEDLIDKHKGETIFVVGCGISFRSNIATSLMEQSHISIGVNQCYRALEPKLSEGEWDRNFLNADSPAFRPTYHLHADTHYGFDKKDILEKLHSQGVEIFTPHNGYLGEGFRKFVVDSLWRIQTNYDKETGLRFGQGKTSIVPAIQLAMMLGAANIVLIGVDFHVPANPTRKWHFYPDHPEFDTQRKKKNYREKHFPDYIAKWRQVWPEILKNMDCKIWNGSKSSKLDCFPKIDIKKAIFDNKFEEI